MSAELRAELALDDVRDAETGLALAASILSEAESTDDCGRRMELVRAAAVLRERHAHVPAAALSADARHRLAAVNAWTTTAALDLLLKDHSRRVRSKAYGAVHARRVWRFVRGID